jgi:ABC-type multidrug transport system ATPase subunit
MKICLERAGKRYQRHWVFKDLTYTFESPGAYTLLGSNGSGKSTLLRVISGLQSASMGKVLYEINGRPLPITEAYTTLAYCAPGMELPEEMTLLECLEFHFSFKKPIAGLSIESIIELTGLKSAAHKPIADYSSGMKQRVKLAQAIFSDTPALLLDEPATNLDEAGVQQYVSWIEQYSTNRLVIIASNDLREYEFCKEQILLSDYQF